jgi:hypothetical protein
MKYVINIVLHSHTVVSFCELNISVGTIDLCLGYRKQHEK